MNILIKNCNLISMSASREKYEEDVDIFISNKRIQKIGKNLEPDSNTKIIDAKGKICLPGLINTHAHLSMSIFRETLDGYSLQDWLTQKIWPMEDNLTREDIYWASLLSFVEMISTGTVLANDQYFMAEDTIEAANKVGARVQLTRTIIDAGNQANEKLEELENLINEYNGKYDNISLNVGVHGLYTTGKETVEKSIKLAKKYNLPVHMHFCENSTEREDIKNNYNVQSPVEVLEECFYDTHNILAHVVKVEDSEIEKMVKMDISVAHCPVSNLRLGCGVAKITKMQEAGINVTLGTDGQGSGSNLDLFESMKFAGLLQKGVNENSKNMESYEVLKMATINGAKALGMENELGSIEEGKLADVILLDLETEICRPIGNVFSNIVYNAKGSNVQTTIINGKIVMENREIPNIDKKEIYKKCDEIINRIKS